MGNNCLKTNHKTTRHPETQRKRAVSAGASAMSEKDITAQNTILALKNAKIPMTAVSLHPEQIPDLLAGIAEDTLIPTIFLTPHDLVIDHDNVVKSYNLRTHAVFVNGGWVSLPGDIPFDYSMVSHKFPMYLLPPVPVPAPGPPAPPQKGPRA